MKNISTILSVLALLGVATLFYLHFDNKDSGKLKKTEPASASSNTFRIAYFDIDSLQTHFEKFKDAESMLKDKEAQKNAELNTENLLCYKEAGIRRIICNNRDRRFHLNIKRSTLYHRHSGN